MSSISSASSRTSVLIGAEVQVALLDQVEQASGCADDDVDAGLEGLDLRLVGAAAVDGEDAGAAGLAGVPDLVGHLHGQLAGGDDDQRLRRRRRLVVGVDGVVRRDQALEQRQREAERLAGAGLGLADDVVAVERHREGSALGWEMPR